MEVRVAVLEAEVVNIKAYVGMSTPPSIPLRSWRRPPLEISAVKHFLSR